MVWSESWESIDWLTGKVTYVNLIGPENEISRATSAMRQDYVTDAPDECTWYQDFQTFVTAAHDNLYRCISIFVVYVCIESYMRVIIYAFIITLQYHIKCVTHIAVADQMAWFVFDYWRERGWNSSMCSILFNSLAPGIFQWNFR